MYPRSHVSHPSLDCEHRAQLGTAHCAQSDPLQEFMQAHSALLLPSLVEHLPPFRHGLGVHGSLLSAVAKNGIMGSR